MENNPGISTVQSLLTSFVAHIRQRFPKEDTGTQWKAWKGAQRNNNEKCKSKRHEVNYLTPVWNALSQRPHIINVERVFGERNLPYSTPSKDPVTEHNTIPTQNTTTHSNQIPQWFSVAFAETKLQRANRMLPGFHRNSKLPLTSPLDPYHTHNETNPLYKSDSKSGIAYQWGKTEHLDVNNLGNW